MRILTLTQPWASLIAIGAKTLETRSWRTGYRGPLAIHAGKGLAGMSESDYYALCHMEPFRSALRPHFARVADLPRGAVVAVCTLADVYAIGEKGLWITQGRAPAGGRRAPLPGEPERSFGDYTPGRFAWRLTEVQPLLRPVPFVGARGLRPIADVAAIGAIFKEVQP